MDNKQIENRSYLLNVKRYIEQVQTIYRIGVCVPAILSPLSLLPLVSKIHLLIWGGSLWFLLLLYHYTIHTKMTCKRLLVLSISNVLISLSIIMQWYTIQLVLSVPTCLFAIYLLIDACSPCKGNVEQGDIKDE